MLCRVGHLSHTMHVLKKCHIAVSQPTWVSHIMPLNPHPLMRGPCGPRKTLSGTCSVVIGIPERTVYLIVHNTEPLHCINVIFTLAYVHLLTDSINATAAPGSVRTPLSIIGDSLLVEWCLQFKHIQTLRDIYQTCRVYLKTSIDGYL